MTDGRTPVSHGQFKQMQVGKRAALADSHAERGTWEFACRRVGYRLRRFPTYGGLSASRSRQFRVSG